VKRPTKRIALLRVDGGAEPSHRPLVCWVVMRFLGEGYGSWYVGLREGTGSCQKEEPTVEYRKLGRSGLVVSELCLGCMTFGSVTGEVEAQRIIDRFFDAGGNFLDTADVYSYGASEERGDRRRSSAGLCRSDGELTSSLPPKFGSHWGTSRMMPASRASMS